jgi:nicotinate phosphoribosyltransferase
MDRPDTALAPAHAAILDKLMDIVRAAGPLDAQTDKYFTNTSRIVAAHGDTEVTFAVFMRRRVVAALEPAIRIARALVPDVKIRRLVRGRRGCAVRTQAHGNHRFHEEAVGSGNGAAAEDRFPCVCANNAYEMCLAMPESGFMDMHARHASGAEMNILAAYGAMVGSPTPPSATTPRPRASSARHRI